MIRVLPEYHSRILLKSVPNNFNSYTDRLKTDCYRLEVHGHSWWILLSDSARFALDRRTRANANTQCFIHRQIINNRAARSFRYTVLPVGSRSRLRSYMTTKKPHACVLTVCLGYGIFIEIDIHIHTACLDVH